MSCGSCTRPTVSVSYDVKGTRTYSQFTTDCGMNDQACTAAFFNRYPVGSSHPAAVNVENPTDIRTGTVDKFNGWLLLPFFIGLVLTAVMLTCLFCTLGALAERMPPPLPEPSPAFPYPKAAEDAESRPVDPIGDEATGPVSV